MNDYSIYQKNKMKKKHKKASSREHEKLKIEIPIRNKKVRLIKNNLVSQNVTKKFSKWPYFTIWIAPSTVKSKHQRATTAGMNIARRVAADTNSFWVPSQSNSRPRSTSKSNNKSYERELVTNKMNIGKQEFSPLENNNNKYQFLKFGTMIKPSSSKKRKNSKKKKSTKFQANDGWKLTKSKRKGLSSECVSDASSLKRKKMQQKVHAFKLTDDQANSILNVSSQGGANLSFINWNINLNKVKTKSNNLVGGRKEYSPKFPLKRGINQMSKNMVHPKWLASANTKILKTQGRQKEAWGSNNFQDEFALMKVGKFTSNGVMDGKNQANSIINPVYSLTDKHWNQDNLVEKCRTHDERNTDRLKLENSTYMMNAEDGYSNPVSRKIQNKSYAVNPSKMHKKPVINSDIAMQKFVKIPARKIIKKRQN